MREGKSTGIKKRHIIPYLFILPAFIIHKCVVTVPALSTLVMSLFDWNGLGNAKFIGLNNFKEIFQDPLVKMSLIHNVEWLLIFITVPWICDCNPGKPAEEKPDVFSNHLFCTVCHFSGSSR